MRLLKRLGQALGTLFGRPAEKAALRIYNEEQLRQMLENAPGHPIWEGVKGLLDEKILEVSDRPLEAVMDDKAVRYHLGGQAALLEFKDELLQWEERNRPRP
jgi:hypothetical protein